VSPFGRRRAGEERRGTPTDLLVVGLGNPGADYAGTRHNVGSDVVELLADRHDGRLRAVKHQPMTADEVRVDGRRLALVRPTTYMNDSGLAVKAAMRRFGVDDVASLVIVHDELDLPVGRIRVKEGGGLAGHNGLKSVRAHVHDDGFVRVRIGVGKPPSKEAGADHVLRRPSRAEQAELGIMVRDAADAVEMIAAEGVTAAMNRFN
jgi:peptidyl-tRNA hydrolase, PTH1 family